MAVRQALLDVDGVASARVTYEPPQAQVRYDADLASPSDLMAAVEDAGFSASPVE